MLVLSRKSHPGENTIVVEDTKTGETLKFVVVRAIATVRVGITASERFRIVREELLECPGPVEFSDPGFVA